MRRSIATLALAAVVAAACTGEDAPVVETAEVRPGEVVQTVATAARMEPVLRTTIAAPAAGPLAEVLVRDGDEVAAGDPLVRLSEDAVAAQIAQAEAALEAAGSLGSVSLGAGFDLAPVIGAFRGTFEGAFPPLIGALEGQVAATEAALVGVITTAAGAADARGDAVRELADAIADAVAESQLAGAAGVELDPELVDRLELGADPQAVAAAITAAEQAAAGAREQLASARAGFEAVAGQLEAAESEAAAAGEQADAAQRAAVEAQREQAELALAAARARVDDLTVVAPSAGVVELAPAAGTGAVGVPDLGGLGVDLGALGGLSGLGDLGGLLGGGAELAAPGTGASAGPTGGAGTVTTSGPITAGTEVALGQPLVTIYDLSAFTAELQVDELDVIEVERGQPVALRVDAFPGVSLRGEVDRVAISPDRGPTGGALYPVSVRLTEVPDEVALRVGLTASAEIEVRRLDGELVVPTSALLRRGGQEVVYVVRDGRAVEVAVTVAAIGDETAALEGALATGEQVVTIGVELMEDGTEVRS